MSNRIQQRQQFEQFLMSGVQAKYLTLDQASQKMEDWEKLTDEQAIDIDNKMTETAN
jgi:hypothetical protein